MIFLAMTLFGLNLDPLYESIAFVESTNGRRSSNVYQIQPCYIRDVNRFMPVFKLSDRLSPYKSRWMMEIYWSVYGRQYLLDTGARPSYETLARIHNGGPEGYKKSATLRYWHRVKKQLEMRGAL